MALPLTIGAVLLGIATSLVVRVLFAFGVGIITYTGMDYVIDDAEAFVMGKFGELPDFAFALLTLSGFDVGIKIIFAGCSAYIAVKTLQGAYKKIGFLPTAP